MTDISNNNGNNVSLFPPKNILLAVSIIVAVLFIIETALWYIDNSHSYLVVVLIGFASLLVVFGIAASSLWVGIKHLLNRRYKSALSTFLSMSILIISFAIPLIFSDIVADYIKFTLHEKEYLEEIHSLKPNYKEFRYTKFLWSGYWREGTELVYDESDEVAMPEHQNDDPECPYSVHKIKSHFYVLRFHCG